ncbi:hypothetical protein V1274_005048 [Bradyrhizobium sp. AZCC 1614]|uniref:hypothetical protein n=1 Tax=Bradyrhizobium sp. AZCC 1614 TaxID=3117017 RepID=UPI002FF12DE4
MAMVLGIFYDASSANYFSVVGNIYDIAGAVLIARALVFVRARSMELQAKSGYGGFSSHLLKMFAEQKVDAAIGLLLLCGGFGMQSLAGWGYKSSAMAFIGIVWDDVGDRPVGLSVAPKSPNQISFLPIA